MNNPAMISHMSDYGILARRPNGAPTALVAGRVSEASRVAVAVAAKTSGVMKSYYLDALILGLVEEYGALPLVDPPQPYRANQIDAIADDLGAADGEEPKKKVDLQGRVSPEAQAAVNAAIDASGVPRTYYLEGLIRKLVAENDGAMPLVDSPRRDRVNQIEEIRKFSEVARRSAA